MKMPAAVQARAEGTVKEDKQYGCVDCTSTEVHFQGKPTLIPGDQQITVKCNAINIYNDGKGNMDALGFFYSEKYIANPTSTNSDLKSYGSYSSGPVSCDIFFSSDGLTNGKTYYIYAQVATSKGWAGVDREDHDIYYLGSCTPVAGAGNTSSGSSASSGSASGTSSSGNGSSEVSGYKAYENRVTGQIEEAQSGSTIVMKKGVTTLSNAVMQELVRKGDVSLRLEFTYYDEEYVIIIPAGAALDNDIPWYGPLYLAQQFGNSAKAKAAPATGGTYAVQPGDSLGKIAARNNMTLSELLAKNPQIKNVDKISVGQNINL